MATVIPPLPKGPFVFVSYPDTAMRVMGWVKDVVKYNPNHKGWHQIDEWGMVELAFYLRDKKIWSVNGAIKHLQAQIFLQETANAMPWKGF